MATYLVAGGAGFIGSHLVRRLVRGGHAVVVLDSLAQGHRAAVADAAMLVEIDLADRAALDDVFALHRFDAVFHCATVTPSGQALEETMARCRANVANTLNLAQASIRSGCLRLVLSSTIDLFVPSADGPASDYGESRWVVERALAWADRVHGLHTAALRLDCAAGCDRDGALGEDHAPETHPIPLAIDASLGLRPPLLLSALAPGDLVHVEDVAAAHLAVLDRLEAGSCQYAVGLGRAVAVPQILDAVERVLGRKVPLAEDRRRPGRAAAPADMAAFAADTGWRPGIPSLDEIVASAWQWRRRHPYGYGQVVPFRRVAS